jgi:hypothetical protein
MSKEYTDKTFAVSVIETDFDPVGHGLDVARVRIAAAIAADLLGRGLPDAPVLIGASVVSTAPSIFGSREITVRRRVAAYPDGPIVGDPDKVSLSSIATGWRERAKAAEAARDEAIAKLKSASDAASDMLAARDALSFDFARYRDTAERAQKDLLSQRDAWAVRAGDAERRAREERLTAKANEASQAARIVELERDFANFRTAAYNATADANRHAATTEARIAELEAELKQARDIAQTWAGAHGGAVTREIAADVRVRELEAKIKSAEPVLGAALRYAAAMPHTAEEAVAIWRLKDLAVDYAETIGAPVAGEVRDARG